ncbi:MAG: transposase [Okeania sp. SIO2F4]|nr:transposase [Okeania sp. SIO2F4]
MSWVIRLGIILKTRSPQTYPEQKGAIAYEFKRQLIYKCEWYGSSVMIADRFYPSSQICSRARVSTENAIE